MNMNDIIEMFDAEVVEVSCNTPQVGFNDGELILSLPGLEAGISLWPRPSVVIDGPGGVREPADILCLHILPLETCETWNPTLAKFFLRLENELLGTANFAENE